MKIAVSGKGGVGKTTLAGALSFIFAQQGYKVLAIDADPDANLASALGITSLPLTPLSQMEELIEERTGAKPGSFGSYFKLNPRVDDIPERFSLEVDGIKLLVMGTVTQGGKGCVCPENALIKALLRHLLLQRDEVVIMDMEAGLEHLGRGTAEGVDALLVVVEPDRRSLQTAQAIKHLAQDIGIKQILVVLNKVEGESQRDFLLSQLKEFKILGDISYSSQIRQAHLKGESALATDKNFVEEMDAVQKELLKVLSNGKPFVRAPQS